MERSRWLVVLLEERARAVAPAGGGAGRDRLDDRPRLECGGVAATRPRADDECPSLEESDEETNACGEGLTDCIWRGEDAGFRGGRCVKGTGSLVSGGATGAHEASVLMGFFIQLAVETSEWMNLFLGSSGRFGAARIGSTLFLANNSNRVSPTSSSSAKATQSPVSALTTMRAFTLLFCVQ